MPDLPTGTVTLLFTDIEGSTRLLHQLGDRFPGVLAAHRELLRAACAAHGGHEVDSRGDSFFAAFPRARQAVAAVVAAQRALAVHPWPPGVTLRVRMGLHTGEPTRTPEGYAGLDVHRGARICDAAHGGQVVLSELTTKLVEPDLPAGVTLRDLSEHRLKDLARPEHLFQLVIAGLPADFAPLHSLDTRPNNIPIPPTRLIGREREIQAVRDLLRREDTRLVTLTGPGGTGKTRLGIGVAAELLHEFRDGAFFVALAPVADPETVSSAIAQALGVREAEGRPLQESLADFLRGKEALLVLDNLEHLPSAAPLVADLLRAHPGLRALVTSRAALRLSGEQEFPVSPLALPDMTHLPPVAALAHYAAVALFIERAARVRPDFTVTAGNAALVAAICARLDGLPLAIELAAARIKLLPPRALLARLGRGPAGSSLRLLTGGARDLPARQQTLRDTIAWSYNLLTPEEQRLFRRLAVFGGGCTLETAEAVLHGGPAGGGAPEGSAIDVADGLASLADKSLLRQDEGADGEPRFLMLETIREFGLEELAASGEEAVFRERHAGYFRALVEAAGAILFSTTRDRVRLAVERDNIEAALRWWVEHG